MSEHTTLYVEEVAAPEGRLQHFPVTFFAVVMGLAGTSLAWRRASEAIGTPDVIATVLAWVAAAAYLAVLVTYLAKLFVHTDAVVAELQHPVRLTFVPTVSIALILVATALVPTSPGLAESLWWAGVVAQLPLTYFVLHAWISRPGLGLQTVTPAWFIPVVGSLAAPLAGPRFDQVELSWFFFGLGIMFWLGLLPIVLTRVFVHESPVPGKLLPTLAVLVAPPAVAFLAYRRLVPGELDPIARILYYAAAAFLVLVLTQLPRLLRLPFFLSWWAYSFPLAAVTVATLTMSEAIGEPLPITAIAWVLFVALNLLVVTLVVTTARGMLQRSICVPE